MNKGRIDIFKNFTFLFLSILISGCGTGPWFIRKNIYSLYKEPIYLNQALQIKTNGYYQKINYVNNLPYVADIIIFDEAGYCLLLDDDLLMENLDSVTSDWDWWQINLDSIIIERYFESERLITPTVNWFKGKLLNDSIIQLSYQSDGIITDYLEYKFIPYNLLSIKNNSPYLSKSWYHENINNSRLSR